MPQVDQPDAGDHAVRVARVLALGHVNQAAVALAWHAAIHEQKSLGQIAEQRLDQVK